MFVTQGIFFEV